VATALTILMASVTSQSESAITTTGVRTTNGGGQAKLVACTNKRTGSFEDDRDLVVVAVNDIRGDKPISRAKKVGGALSHASRGSASREPPQPQALLANEGGCDERSGTVSAACA